MHTSPSTLRGPATTLKAQTLPRARVPFKSASSHRDKFDTVLPSRPHAVNSQRLSLSRAGDRGGPAKHHTNKDRLKRLGSVTKAYMPIVEGVASPVAAGASIWSAALSNQAKPKPTEQQNATTVRSEGGTQNFFNSTIQHVNKMAKQVVGEKTSP